MKNNISVVSFPIERYDRSYLDGLSDKELSETALADGDCGVWSNLESFQDDLNNDFVDTENNWIYFLDNTSY